MNSTIYLVIGRYGAGKNTLIDKFCEKYGYTKLCSYTTRDESGSDGSNRHIYTNVEQYVTDSENNAIVAETKLMNEYYWSTFDQVENSDFYIIDPKGLSDFRLNYNGNRQYRTIYIKTDPITCLNRLMQKDNDISPESIAVKLSKNELNNTKYDDKYLENMCDHTIENNTTVDTAIEKLRDFVHKTETEA